MVFDKFVIMDVGYVKLLMDFYLVLVDCVQYMCDRIVEDKK